MKWILTTGFLFASCAGAATTGRVIVDQTADADRGRAAVRTELKLTQAFAFPRSWVSGETRYQVLVVPEATDLAGLRASRDPDDWASDFVRRKDARALTFMIDADGGAVEMYLYGDGIQSLGASGTMGKVHAPRIEDGRLRGHYLKYDDLFGSTIVIDLQFDAEIWKAPASKPLPADGGDAGKAYLGLIAAVRKGDQKQIMAHSRKDAEPMSDEEFKDMLPMMQAMMPKSPKIQGGSLSGNTAVLSIIDGATNEPASAEMELVDGRWVMVSSSSGSDDATRTPPPPFAGAEADLCPEIIREGVVCGDVTFNDEAFAIRHVIAAQSDESRHIALLAPGKLDAAHTSALWDTEAPIEPLFVDGPMRGLLLMFDGSTGKLGGDSGYHIDPEKGFTEEFMLRGDAVRIGDRMYGSYTVTKTNQDTGENTQLSVLRFEAPVLDKR
ncbi:MAG: hypothetical protein IPK97_01285 [Ahniella sp.]|nr:hypothetical protein [Ahniella sp.]